MSTTTAPPTGLTEAIAAGHMSGRVWMYSNYHCNLACSYCLTESAPKVPQRLLDADKMRRVVREAAELGFTEIGITGGEPFLVRDLPELIAEFAQILPVVVLSNATMFTPPLVDRMRPLAEAPVRIQISLDRPDPVPNDEMRGPQNFRKVVEAVPRLVDAGIGVRIATTLELGEIQAGPTAEHERLCELHRGLGVADADHVIRPIVARGRALTAGMGVGATRDDLEPELTITNDGAFWNPFGPTVVGARLDTDLLLTRTTAPLRISALTMLRLVRGRPQGTDSALGIR
ncbi:MAG: radical SAM protein [Actinomycetota bacterium]|nr:radical SAM protein [Actinomycetota bacterium]